MAGLALVGAGAPPVAQALGGLFVELATVLLALIGLGLFWTVHPPVRSPREDGYYDERARHDSRSHDLRL